MLVIPNEPPDEARVAVVPSGVAKLIALGMSVGVEAGLGRSLFSDADYQAAGAKLFSSRDTLLADAQIVLRLRTPSIDEIVTMSRGTIHISLLDPFRSKDVVDAFCKAGVTALSLEMIPRTTRAQKMDVQSSQASLSGYAAVIMAASEGSKVLPMMTTPSGTIPPAHVFVIGAGVAGLQAIATAKRLGAMVDAFDTRPAVAEQVQSLGARFIRLDLGETGETDGGYAHALTEAQLAQQHALMADTAANADIVITTAQVFGRPAPRVITDAMIQRMKPGSVIVDMAVKTGGNVEGSVADQVTLRHGVLLLAPSNLPSRVALDASQMVSTNVVHLVTEFWQSESGFRLDFSDEILASAVITHNGLVVNAALTQGDRT